MHDDLIKRVSQTIGDIDGYLGALTPAEKDRLEYLRGLLADVGYVLRDCKAALSPAQAMTEEQAKNWSGVLLCDLRSDEEKSNFFLSGRAYETGIVAHAAQNDIAMAYHRCAEYRKEVEELRQLPGVVPGQWHNGAPEKPWSEEWFIAETTYGDRVVLRALPDEYDYDFKTADDTYIKRDKLKRWMQFPDSQFIAPTPAPAHPAMGMVWISADEQLPKASGVYPAIAESRPPKDWQGALCYFNAEAKPGESRWQHSSGFYDNGITHWLPLNASPATDTEGGGE